LSILGYAIELTDWLGIFPDAVGERLRCQTSGSVNERKNEIHEYEYDLIISIGTIHH
jgi:hypothetical protein